MNADVGSTCQQEDNNPEYARQHLLIARIPEEHNTALYFERAARNAGLDVTVIYRAKEIRNAKPVDLLLAIDPWFDGVQVLPELPCPTAVVLVDVHRSLPVRAMYARYFDQVFVAQHDFVPGIAAIGHDGVHWLPLGGDPGVHYVPGLTRDIDLGFVGKLGTPGTDRHAVLSQVLGRFSTNQIGRPQTPWEMGESYSRSRIVFNKSIDGDVNMRFFEALASGALLVTDRIGNGLNELAEEGVHYVGYDTAEEAIAQIEHYLAHDVDRERIAQAGQVLLQERHTYDARLQQILRTVAAGTRSAPARLASPQQRRLWLAEWARFQGISLTAAARLLAKGLAPAGFGNLAIGIARGAKRKMDALW